MTPSWERDSQPFVPTARKCSIPRGIFTENQTHIQIIQPSRPSLAENDLSGLKVPKFHNL